MINLNFVKFKLNIFFNGLIWKDNILKLNQFSLCRVYEVNGTDFVINYKNRRWCHEKF